MDWLTSLLTALLPFFVVALASDRFGRWFRLVRLPLITGFLFTGVLAGPSVLGLIPAEALPRLRFLDDIALALIAFAAGGELYLDDLRGKFGRIGAVSAGLVIATLLLCVPGFFALGSGLPGMDGLGTAGRWAVALLAAAILVARSPSSAIAIVRELRARGPFTSTVLGVTVFSDVVVIVLFSAAMAVADAALTAVAFNPLFMALLLAELLVSLLVGAIVWKAVSFLLGLELPLSLKTGGLLSLGWSVFMFSRFVRQWSHQHFGFEFLVEPLFVCMVAGFLVTNRSRSRIDFAEALHRAGPPVYTVFFTLTGASLNLAVLAATWPLALALFTIRLGGIALGSGIGGMIGGAPARTCRLSWMAYITQAGVGLGLAKKVADEFPAWGGSFASVMIAVIVLNQLAGPPLFKWVFERLGEARSRKGEEDEERRVIIFGLEDQALALAVQLEDHGWQAMVASRRAADLNEPPENSPVAIEHIDDLSPESLRRLGAPHADALVCLLSDEENLRICRTARESFDTDTLVVRLHDRGKMAVFHELGALIVDPTTALVSLMDHLVRAPSATSLLLGLDSGQDVIELEVRGRALEGMAIRDLDLPLNALTLSVRRGDRMIMSHGYTRLARGDRVSILVGSSEERKAVRRLFRGYRDDDRQ